MVNIFINIIKSVSKFNTVLFSIIWFLDTFCFIGLYYYCIIIYFFYNEQFYNTIFTDWLFIKHFFYFVCICDIVNYNYVFILAYDLTILSVGTKLWCLWLHNATIFNFMFLTQKWCLLTNKIFPPVYYLRTKGNNAILVVVLN